MKRKMMLFLGAINKISLKTSRQNGICNKKIRATINSNIKLGIKIKSYNNKCKTSKNSPNYQRVIDVKFFKLLVENPGGGDWVFGVKKEKDIEKE